MLFGSPCQPIHGPSYALCSLAELLEMALVSHSDESHELTCLNVWDRQQTRWEWDWSRKKTQEKMIIDDHSNARNIRKCFWRPVLDIVLLPDRSILEYFLHTVPIRKIMKLVDSQETAASLPRCHGGCKSRLPKPQWTSSQLSEHNNHDVTYNTRPFAAVLSICALQIPSISESSATMTCMSAKPALKKIRPGAGSTFQVTSTWPIRLYSDVAKFRLVSFLKALVYATKPSPNRSGNMMRSDATWIMTKTQ